jgi:ATP-dependent DNA helicase RecG
MLSPDFVQTLLSSLESDSVERTASTNNTDKFAQAICAFGNDYPNHRLPGYLIVGANDDGSLSGLSVSDELLRNLAAIRADGNVLPPPAMTVERVVMNSGDEVAVVVVQPSTVPPIRYKGRVYIRVGPRKGIANEQEERILSERRASLVTSFDAQPVRESSVTDLTMRLFDEYRLQTVDADTVAANHRTTEEKLASLRCYDLTANAPTVAGILLFGSNPRYFLPGSYVQFLKFSGTTLTDRPDDEIEVSGDLRTVVETMRQKIIGHNHSASAQGNGFRDDSLPEYPEWAMRELFHNALIHRDYHSNTPVRFYWFADRIEIQSPGGLYGEVTQTTLTRRSSYRNPVLAEAMKSMGYVNRYGYGIQRAQSLLQANGNPPPDFEIDDRVFLVTIRRRIQ